MNVPKRKHLGLRIDEDLHRKIFYIARSRGISGHAYIMSVLRKDTEEFEKLNGPIPAAEKPEKK